jgi:hypothetical protein
VKAEEDRNKPQQDKIGVHRDFITEVDYGGQPDEITQGWDGIKEHSTKEFYYAPGSGAFLARLQAEYPDYFGNRSQDQISQNPNGYTDHISDSTEYKPRIVPYHDKDVRLDRLPGDKGYQKTGYAEPPWAVDQLDQGQNSYPLRAAQSQDTGRHTRIPNLNSNLSPNIQSVTGSGIFGVALSSGLEKSWILGGVGGSLEKEKVTNEDGAYTISYERDPNNPKSEAFAVAQDLYAPEDIATAPFIYLRKAKNGKWEASGGSWKPNKPNWPQGRLDEALPWILSHVPEKLETVFVPKATKKEKGALKNTDNKKQEGRALPDDADAIEKVFFRIKPSAFTADVFFGNLGKAKNEIKELFKARPSGDGKYFRWKIFNGNDLMVTRKS